ncbi:MAG TPA: LuxR C-terminal-related transcriptional regulator [Spirochaetia bacterium]|nr:LuxR C-terminal-related transcriptional regulator [Spirochaetia bacterium]
MEDAGLGSESILQTKIVRPPVRNILHRTRLYELLDIGAARKLTIVSAPAGYGKTTLVASWLGERSLDCCWVNLGRLDGSAQQVTMYLVAALDRLEKRKSATGSNRWVAFLNALTARQRQTIVVLDDYHLAESAEVNDLVMLLLEHLPPTAHLVIVTRVDPALRLAKLRGQGELAEIRQADLALTREETKAFLTEVSGVTLTKEVVQSLSLATEGWAAGLQILTSSFRDGADPSRLIEELIGRQRYLRDYLVEEVLAQLDSPTLEFLERCSILEELSADLCAAVTGRTDSRELLFAIDRQNLFVSPRDEEHCWFRLHHLFAEVLSARLQDGHAEELPVLHRKASEWFVAHNQPVEAINHRLASGDAEAAAELINGRAEWLMKQGELMVARKWIGSLPEEICARYPVIMLLRAWAGIEEGRPLGQIERELDAIKGTGAYEAQVLCLRSNLAGLQGKDEKALQLSEKATRIIDEPDLFVSGYAKFRVAVARLASGETSKAIDLLESAADESLQAGNRLVAAEALAHRARAMVGRGELDGGEQTYQRALDLVAYPGGSRRGYVAWALIGLGEINRLRGNIDGALELFREGMETYANWLDLNTFYTSLGIVHALLAKGRDADALDALQSAEGLARRSTVPLYFTRLVEAHRTLVLLRCGQLQEARARMKERSSRDALSTDVSYVEALVSDLEILAQARLALLEKNPRACADLALSIALRARKQERELHALHADIVLVQAFWQTEEIDKATSVLERGLSFAAERGIVQPFVDEGPEFARVLYRARALGVDHPLVGKLLAAFPLDQQSTAAADTQPHSVEPLSARELKVLTLLSQGLSNKEVAATLYLSLPTVKWYTSNIYAKLDVSSRTQAIAKARRLGILPE